jgi:hypothetical protein
MTGDLEVLALGKALVPVLALRGLSDQVIVAAAAAGTTDASIQLDDRPPQKLACAPSVAMYLCSPGDDAARTLAEGLPAARSLTVRVSVTMSGLKPLPIQTKHLVLSGTGAALLRLRAAGPTQVPGAIEALRSGSSSGLAGAADRALKAAGYPNGVTDLQGLVAKYIGMTHR